jgi:hypothetical protein
MDGSAFEQQAPLSALIEWLQEGSEAARHRETQTYTRVIDEVDSGEWRLEQWADELGISEDEMLIELDRHLHHRPAA